jgi:hypothetical protein
MKVTATKNFVYIDNSEDKMLLMLTIEEAEEFWQQIMEACHNYRRDEQIIKVSN